MDLEIDRGWAELRGVRLRGESIDLEGCERLEIAEASLDAVELVNEPGAELEIRGSSLADCDLSGRRIVTLRKTTVADAKFVGADLSAAAVADVVFERCVFRLTSFRMARVERVRFLDCSLDDVDLFEATLDDVSFPDSTIEKLNVDRVQASDVDLTEASRLGLSGVGRLDGFRVSEMQVIELATTLATATGLSIDTD